MHCLYQNNKINLYSKATNSNTTVSSSNSKVVEKLSDKHIYRVLIRSNQLLPKNGFNMQILFLNASSNSRAAIVLPPSLPIVMKQLVPSKQF
ncbi:MAG TPA: hypothetical protein VE619_09315 [Nitrososphaeraceae archaeon]|nr:hypothetical protein [Nitrososphaeraceae archaeon]